MISHTFTVTSLGSANPTKQDRFAIASALTKTGKEVQAADIKAVDDAFTIRTNWPRQGPLAFRVTPANKNDDPIVCIVGTNADFLEKFVREPEGAIVVKLPRGEFIAIPTSNVKRTKRDIIRAAQRPRNLRGKRDIVLPMRNGRGMVLLQERGRGRNTKRVALYILVPRAKVKERDVIFGPAEKVFSKRFATIYAEQAAIALATAK